MRKATNSEDEPPVWQPSLTVKGHFSDVSDLAWDEHELSLVSASTDQTTRIFAEHTVPGCWYEVGRPQIHGYDINAICTVKNTSNEENSAFMSSKILSGGDEKVLRLFEAPYNFVKTMNSLSPHLGADGTPNMVYSKEHSNAEVENMIEDSAKK